MGQYASAPATVILNDTPTSIEARLDLYQSPACQLYATFTTEAPDDWAVFHTDSCLYQVSGGTVTLRLKIRVHYPGGNDLIEGSTSFERVDADWTAVVWTKFGIRLEAIAET